MNLSVNSSHSLLDNSVNFEIVGTLPVMCMNTSISPFDFAVLNHLVISSLFEKSITCEWNLFPIES